MTRDLELNISLFRHLGTSLLVCLRAGEEALAFLLFTAVGLLAVGYPLAGLGQATPAAGRAVDAMLQAGFENVQAAVRNDTLFLSLENRVWRSQARGAAEAVKGAMPFAGPAGVVSLTLLRDGIAVTTVAVPRQAFDGYTSGLITREQFTAAVFAGPAGRSDCAAWPGIAPAHPSFRKFDVTLGPQLRMRFGNFDRPLEVGFCLAPAVQVTLRRGMRFTAEALIPLYTNLIDDPEGYAVRPGRVTLSQTFRLPFHLYTTLSAGSFTRNRYGFDGEARQYLFGGRAAVGAGLGYTGRLRVMDGSFLYTAPDRLTWFVDASWRWARYNLLLEAGYGGFIAGDRGWRAAASRQFGEITAGFYAQHTGGVWNGGFRFVVPLPPRHYGTKGRVRVRPVSHVAWEYRARGLPEQGTGYATGDRTGDWMPGFDPGWIRRGMGEELLNNRTIEH